MTVESEKRRGRGTRAVICAICAGLLNGLLGTGGGIPLWFAAVKEGDRRRAFATSSAGVLALSLFSIFLSGAAKEGAMALHPAVLPLAVLGGAVGALLLGRIPLTLLKWVFSGLLCGSGLYTLMRLMLEWR